MENEYPIANASEADPETGLFLMWMGAYGTKVYVWADHFETAFEHMVEWADDNAPGVLTDIREPELREAAETLGIEWEPTWLTRDHDYNDRNWIKVQEYAEIDLTVIGHTTMKHGQYIPSYEWGGDQISDEDEVAQVLRRSQIEAWGHDFIEGDEVIWRGHEEGDPDRYEVGSVNGDDLELVGERSNGEIVGYDMVNASEVKHAR
jgi:hypothetical protein